MGPSKHVVFTWLCALEMTFLVIFCSWSLRVLICHPPGGLLGVILALLGHSWGPPGSLLGLIFSLLGLLGIILALLGNLLGPPGAILALQGANLGPAGAYFGPPGRKITKIRAKPFQNRFFPNRFHQAC